MLCDFVSHVLFFFFSSRRRHTRLQGDWSSDVCSSDLVSGYRGLWGLYTRDPFEGEDAPAGPMYDRDKTISREWYDPVGWAGLDKVPTRTEELDVIIKRQAEIEERRARLRSEIQEMSSRLKALGMGAEATRGRSHLSKLYETQTRHIEVLSKEVEEMRAELSEDEVLHESLSDHV